MKIVIHIDELLVDGASLSPDLAFELRLALERELSGFDLGEKAERLNQSFNIEHSVGVVSERTSSPRELASTIACSILHSIDSGPSRSIHATETSR